MQPQWKLQIVEVPLTVSLAAYTAGDSVGNDATDTALVSESIEQIKGGGYIAWARLVDDAKQSEGFDLWCFYEQPSAIADAAEYIPTEADRLKQFTTIELAAADYDGTGADSSVIADGKDKTADEYIIFPNLVGGLLYFYLVCAITPDYASVDDLTLHIGVMVM